MNLVIFLSIILNFNGIAIKRSSAKKLLAIGGIFETGNYNGEIVFRSTIQRANLRVTENRNIEFIPSIRHIDPTDTFQAERITCDLIKEGVVGIFGPSSKAVFSVVASVCNTFGIPHILTHWTDEEFEKNRQNYMYTRNFFPESRVYSRALASVIADYNWKSFTFIYQDTDSLLRLQDALQIHGPTDEPVTIRRIEPGVDIKPMLKEIHSKLIGDANIILDCSPDILLDVLRQASAVKLMEYYQTYLITSLDAHLINFSEIEYINANVTTIRMMDVNSYEVQAAVHDWQESERMHNSYTQFHPEKIRTEFALLNDALNAFIIAVLDSDLHRPVQYFASGCSNHQGKWQHGQLILDTMEKMIREERILPGMSGPIEIDEDGYRTNFYLEVLEHSSDGFKKIAVWDSNIGVKITRTADEYQSQLYFSLINRTVIVASRTGMPYLKYKDDHTSRIGNDRFEGYSLDLIEGVSRIVGFKYRLEIVPDNNYGSYNPATKKWDGLVKHLLDRKADIAVCDLTITYERRRAVDFTTPFMPLGISILYARPRKESPGLFSFMKPLSIHVWMYVATASLVLSVILFLLTKMAKDDWENPHPCNKDPDELESIWNIRNCAWLIVGSIMQQGCDLLPKAISTRLTAGLWWFFALIVISSYTANLAAFLTMERMDKSIENAEDLAKQSKIKYGAVTTGSTLAFFRTSNNSLIRRMYAFMESTDPSPFTDNNEEGAERVDKGNRLYAFLMESTAIEYITKKNCNLTGIGGLLDNKGYGIAVPMNSPYLSLINQAVLRMKEEGKIDALKHKWWEEKNDIGDCDVGKSGGSGTPELGLDNVGGVFLVLLCGMSVAMIIGIFEFLWNVRKVAVQGKMTPWKAFKREFKFAINLGITTKAAKPFEVLDNIELD